MQAVILKQRNGTIGAEVTFTYCAMFNYFADKENDTFVRDFSDILNV